MKITVFTDLRFTSHSKPTGVGKHIVQMAWGLAAERGNQVSVLAAHDQVDGERRIPSQNGLAGLPATVLPLPWKMAEALWTVTGLPYANRWCGNPDWVYCPKNDFIPIRKSKVAVTVHGAHELDPQMPQSRTLSARLNRLRRRTSYHRMLRQATLVLTVSEFLKEQMVRWFQVEPEKCCVVGNGVEPEFFRAAGLEAGSSGESAGRPFVLCVGGLNYLDGGDRMLRLASLLRTKAPDLRVLVAGSQHEEVMRRAAAELPNITLLGYVPAERLALYMRDSLALFFPTRYETFGIAAAEAMAAGTPVVTCRSTAVPEVVGDAAIYVEPDQPESTLEALAAIQSDSGLRADLIGRGRRRSQAYTWPACVARLQQALEQG
jgi:glycosyltransferase involved in cell wall biosynthesis